MSEGLSEYDVPWNDAECDPWSDILDAKKQFENGLRSPYIKPYCYNSGIGPTGKKIAIVTCILFCHSKYFLKCSRAGELD